jgi:hypothetical protein
MGETESNMLRYLGVHPEYHAESVNKYKLTSSSVHAMGPTFLSLLIADFETTCWIVSYCSCILWISWKSQPFSCYHFCHLVILSFHSEIVIMSLCRHANYCISLGLRITPSNEPNRFDSSFSLLYVKMEVIHPLKYGFVSPSNVQCMEFQSQLFGTGGSTRVHCLMTKLSHIYLP